VRVRRRDRVVDIRNGLAVGATARIRELADREVEFVFRPRRDVVRILDIVNHVEEGDGFGVGQRLTIPDRHPLRELADLDLDIFPRSHGILVLRLKGSHVAETEPVTLAHDANGTVRADLTAGEERAEERSGPLEVVKLEKVVPILTVDLAAVVELAAVDLEHQHLVRPAGEHEASLRRHPALGDQRGDRGDHVDRARRDVLFRDRFRRDHDIVRRANEVVLSLDVLITMHGVRCQHGLHAVVHTLAVQEVGRCLHHVDSPLLLVRADWRYSI